jgi:hypothetical protein
VSAGIRAAFEKFVEHRDVRQQLPVHGAHGHPMF